MIQAATQLPQQFAHEDIPQSIHHEARINLYKIPLQSTKTLGRELSIIDING